MNTENNEYVIEVEGLKKHFPLRDGLFGQQTGQLRAVDGVTEVKVYDRTRDAVVCFACGRGDVIASLAAFSFPRAEAMDLVPEHTSRALNREFEDKLTMTVARRMVSRLFLPAPVTTALAAVGAQLG